MEELTFDIETDGLLEDVTKIHCISLKIGEGPVVLYDTEFGIKDACNWLTCDPFIIIGHNIKAYDLPVIQKLYGFKIHPDSIIRDTMLMGYIRWPERESQTLESWGLTVGSKASKIKIEEWHRYTPEIGERNKEDVQMNWDIWKYMSSRFDDWDALEKEQKVAEVQLAQELYGVYIDQKHAKDTVATFDDRLGILRDRILKWAPKAIKHPYAEVKNVYLKGTARHTKNVRDWFPEAYLGSVQGPFSKIIIEPFAVDSPAKVKELLLSLGWRPTDYNVVREKDGSFRRTSPKLTEDSYASIPPGLGKTIAEYNTLKHRRRSIENEGDPEGKGLLSKVRKDGRVSARAITCGTPTSRYRHMGPVCNIPRPSSMYGGEIRACYSSPPGSLLLGIDLSGIEARLIAHYALEYPGGSLLADEILDGDWHQANADTWGVDRNTAKSILYALVI